MARLSFRRCSILGTKRILWTESSSYGRGADARRISIEFCSTVGCSFEIRASTGPRRGNPGFPSTCCRCGSKTDSAAYRCGSGRCSTRRSLSCGRFSSPSSATCPSSYSTASNLRFFWTVCVCTSGSCCARSAAAPLGTRSRFRSSFWRRVQSSTSGRCRWSRFSRGSFWFWARGRGRGRSSSAGPWAGCGRGGRGRSARRR